MLLIPLLQLLQLGEKNVTLISFISYCQYKAGFPSQLSAAARCLPGSRGSPAPLFIWRALGVLQNVSSHREHPAPPADRYDYMITCGSPRWWPIAQIPALRLASAWAGSVWTAPSSPGTCGHHPAPSGQLWPSAVPRLPGQLIRKHCRCAASQKRDHCNSPVSNFLERNCSKLQSAGPKKGKALWPLGEKVKPSLQTKPAMHRL